MSTSRLGRALICCGGDPAGILTPTEINPKQRGYNGASKLPPIVVGGNALYGIYETKDGDYVVLAGQEPKFARNLLEPLGRPDLVELCKLPPGPGQDPVRAFLRDVFRTKTKAEWVEWFKGRDVAFAPMRTLPEALDDAHFKARGMVLKDARSWDHLGVPIRFADEPARPDFDPPAHGQHTLRILRSLGYADGEIAQLKSKGVVKGP